MDQCCINLAVVEQPRDTFRRFSVSVVPVYAPRSTEGGDTRQEDTNRAADALSTYEKRATVRRDQDES